MQPLVSVGMPMYNRPKEMQVALDCIINQTYKNLEIIVSNDASPNPEVYKILDGYAARDTRIKLTHQPHDIGCYGNYQFVLQQATGEYFMYAQDDDEWEPTFVEKLVQQLYFHPEQALAISAVTYYGSEGNYATYRFHGENLFTLILGEKIPFLWMGLWRLPILKQFDYDAEDIHGKDIIIAAEALMEHPYGYVDSILYHKMLYYDKALKYVTDNPLCHFQMTWYFIVRALASKHICVRNKLKLAVAVPAFGLRIIQSYAAQPFYLLMFYHYVRIRARNIYNKVYANE